MAGARQVQAFLDLHPNYLPEGWQSRTVPLPTPTADSAVTAVGGVWRLLLPAQPASASFVRRCIWLGVLAVVAAATCANWNTAVGVSKHLADDQQEPPPALVALFEERSKITRNDAAYTRRAQAESGEHRPRSRSVELPASGAATLSTLPVDCVLLALQSSSVSPSVGLQARANTVLAT